MDQPATAIRHRETPGPRPRRASLIWLIGALLLAYSTAIAVTGGIDVTLAGVRIRSRTWQRPAMLAIACLATVAIADRRRAAVLTRRAVQGAARVWAGAIGAHLSTGRRGDCRARDVVCRADVFYVRRRRCRLVRIPEPGAAFFTRPQRRRFAAAGFLARWHRQAGAARIPSHARSPASRSDLPAWLSVVDGAGVPDSRTRAAPGRAALRRTDRVVDVCAGAQAPAAGGWRSGCVAGLGQSHVPVSARATDERRSGHGGLVAGAVSGPRRDDGQRGRCRSGCERRNSHSSEPDAARTSRLEHVPARRTRRQPLVACGRVSDRDPSVRCHPRGDSVDSVWIPARVRLRIERRICSDWRTSGPTSIVIRAG